MPALQVANYNIPLKFRISLCKLKCSIHNVNVETDRHSYISYEHRLCVLWNKHKIEDKFYFVLSCPVYNQIRSVFLPNIDTENDYYNLYFLQYMKITTRQTNYLHIKEVYKYARVHMINPKYV